jgi:hypothetical protein
MTRVSLRPIPAGRRDKKKFKNAGEMLAWTLDRFHYRRRQGLKLALRDPVAANRFIALATFTRVAAGHAQAILAMSRKSVAEAGFVNVRAMLEIWADFRLVAKDASARTFERAYLAGALALLRKSPDAKVESALRSRFGASFDEAVAQSKKSRFGHWSGGGRKGVVAAQCGDMYGDYYELLSWDSHPVVQVALDFQAAEKKPGRFQLGHRESQHAVATQNCVMATHILRDMWNELVKNATT